MNNEKLKAILSIPENAEVEYKSAKGGFPGTFWDTFSAFANTNGGVIVLGMKEKNGRPISDMLAKDEAIRLQKMFWDNAHNPQKVNHPLLVEDDVHVEPLDDESWVLVVEVPRAEYSLRPIFLNGQPYGNTYKRRHEGDYHCTNEEVNLMFSDANHLQRSSDARILKGFTLEDLDIETLKLYRKAFDKRHEESAHPWSELDDMNFLKKVGAYRRVRETGEEGFTVAGLLMFGKTESICAQECLPYYFVDYQEHLIDDPAERWSDRIYPDGRWEANLYQFFNKVLNRLYEALPKPFRLANDGVTRVGYTTAHVALREALANCLIHAAYTQNGSVLVNRWKDRIELSNQGTMLISVEQFYKGNQSVCRNPVLQKMFVLLGIGEKAGSGADTIVKGWEDNKWTIPTISEQQQPERVKMTMLLTNKTDNNTDNNTDSNTDNNTSTIPTTIEAEKRVVDLLLQGEKRISELMEVCQYKDRDSFRKSVLNAMIERGVVEMTHPENPTHRRQMYRLNMK